MSTIPVIFLIFALGLNEAAAQEPAEKIVYTIATRGRAEYEDLGLVNIKGRTARLVTFHTRVLGLNDLEKIYADPKTLLPIRVERYVRFAFRKERLVEEYSDDHRSLVIKKYARNRIVKEYRFHSDGHMHNAILLPFYLRNVPEPVIGMTVEAFLPQAFKVRLVSVDEITVPAGTYEAYHFVSDPHKFEIWISKDADRLPLKIVGAGVLSYKMAMKWHEKHDSPVLEKSQDKAVNRQLKTQRLFYK